MSSLAVIILTKNEEKHIEAAIQNAKKCADEVLIIDSGSTDNTVAIAKKNGAIVRYRAWDDDFAAQRNFALEQTTADWVLYLDADERMDETMCREIRYIVVENRVGEYGLKREVIFNGYRFKHGIFAPDIVYRLFPREAVTWVGKVHEHPETNLQKSILKGALDHYSYESWHHWLQKADHYTTIWAEEQYSKGKRITLGKAFSHSFVGGLRALLLKGAFLDGWMGVFSSYQHAFYTMLKYVKLHELQQREKGK